MKFIAEKISDIFGYHHCYKNDADFDGRVFSPSILRLDNGDLLATCDVAGKSISKIEKNIANLKGEFSRCSTPGGVLLGKIFRSVDNGYSWKHVEDFPFRHARLFQAGSFTYVIGELDDICIMGSYDGGKTWFRDKRGNTVFKLTQGETWHAAPTNVWEEDDHIYLAMERMDYNGIEGWNVAGLSPVVLKAYKHSLLTDPRVWTMADSKPFCELTSLYRSGKHFGIPRQKSLTLGPYVRGERFFGPQGWLETNVVRIMDHRHIWHDEEYPSIHILMRAHTGAANIALLMRVRENHEGSEPEMETLFQFVENSSCAQTYINLPGGHLKFHLLYDPITKMYWNAHNVAVNSGLKTECLSEKVDHYANNERHILGLSFSPNLIDWHFAGLIDVGGTPGTPNPREARSYPSMVFNGNDLSVVVRSGSPQARNTTKTDMMSYYNISNFRQYAEPWASLTI
jgi:hypothetical protein